MAYGPALTADCRVLAGAAAVRQALIEQFVGETLIEDPQRPAGRHHLR
ncbi:MAG: hypothetical protein JO106_17755 [Mycobacterium sp.]|nr:hypothetical protein [Mycobacterium sp.]